MGSDDAVMCFERKLLAHCSPTIAGLKPANMFTLHLKCTQGHTAPRCASLGFLELSHALESCRARLAGQGVRIHVLAQRPASVLLLVYRPQLLGRVLGGPREAAFLVALGYEPADVQACLQHLARRVAVSDQLAGAQRTCAFPHEVGLFLGYPFEDVVAFIENGGRGSVACGCWKVYSQERDAAECFCRYKECTRECARRYEQGAALEELAAAGRAAEERLAA